MSKTPSLGSQLKLMGTRLQIAAIPLVLASLAACTPTFDANVKRFQSELPAPAGQTFAVVAEDPALDSDRGKAARLLLWLLDQDRAIRLLSVG